MRRRQTPWTSYTFRSYLDSCQRRVEHDRAELRDHEISLDAARNLFHIAETRGLADQTMPAKRRPALPQP